MAMDGNTGGKGSRASSVSSFDAVLLKDSLLNLEMIRHDLIL